MKNRPKTTRYPARSLVIATAPLLIFALDALMWRRRYPRSIRGPLDEVAHGATAVALLGPLCQRDNPAWLLGALGGATLLDIDHLPQAFGARWLAAPGERPYPHSLLFSIALSSVGRMGTGRWRSLTEGLAAGVTTHLLRDMATGGVLFYWPLVRRSIQIPYWSYAALLLCLALAETMAQSRRCKDR